METSMSNWNTKMKLFYNDGCITADQIKIKRGIFQGDSFLPLLFCLALVPLHQSWLHLHMAKRSQTPYRYGTWTREMCQR